MLSNFEERLTRAVNYYNNSVKDFGAERVSPSWINELNIKTEEGNRYLKELASVTIMDNRSLNVKPWDKNSMVAIEASLSRYPLVSSIIPQKDHIICTFPEITMEERVKLNRKLSEMTEQAKKGMREIRQEAIHNIKAQKLSENNEKRELKDLQTVFDKYMRQVEDCHSAKENQLLRK